MVVTAGQDHEAPLLYRLVETFVEHHGRGVMKRLILDRGFLDGAQIGRCKQEWGIHVLIPARKNMDIYQDVLGLAETGELSFQPWVGLPPPLRNRSRSIALNGSKREKRRDKEPWLKRRLKLLLRTHPILRRFVFALRLQP